VGDVQTLMEWEAVAYWGKNEGEGLVGVRYNVKLSWPTSKKIKQEARC